MLLVFALALALVFVLAFGFATFALDSHGRFVVGLSAAKLNSAHFCIQLELLT